MSSEQSGSGRKRAANDAPLIPVAASRGGSRSRDCFYAGGRPSLVATLAIVAGLLELLADLPGECALFLFARIRIHP